MVDHTLVALFTDRDRAEAAVRDLETAGFAAARISIVGVAPAGRPDGEPTTLAPEAAGAGATLGALIGGGAGVLAGLGLVTLPDIGAVLAGGPLVATLATAGVGVTAGGLAGALIGLGVPRQAAASYAEEIRRDGALVILDVADEQRERATLLIERHDPEDVAERALSAPA